MAICTLQEDDIRTALHRIPAPRATAMKCPEKFTRSACETRAGWDTLARPERGITSRDEDTSMADFIIGENLLGDSIWPEPALTAAGLAAPEGYIGLHVENLMVRELYRHNQCIRLLDERPADGRVLDCSAAWHWAIDHQRYFAAGFWEQVGLGEPREG